MRGGGAVRARRVPVGRRAADRLVVVYGARVLGRVRRVRRRVRARAARVSGKAGNSGRDAPAVWVSVAASIDQRSFDGCMTKDADGFRCCVPIRNSRVETLMTYAQSVYLLFASVYVCKETVEHVLLASGEGHHHHHGDEVADVYG